MRDTIEEVRSERTSKARRLLWFIGIYVASLIVFSALVYLLRWVIAGS